MFLGTSDRTRWSLTSRFDSCIWKGEGLKPLSWVVKLEDDLVKLGGAIVMC